ncbi:MAG: TraX family protein [Desulfobacter sp.]
MIKLIAFAAMITDHACIFFFPQHELFMRSIGALSFPLFAYGICKGLKYTKDLQIYIISLVTCACITQPMFNLLFPHLHRLNDLYTLLFGLIVLVLYENHGPKALCPSCSSSPMWCLCIFSLFLPSTSWKKGRCILRQQWPGSFLLSGL